MDGVKESSDLSNGGGNLVGFPHHGSRSFTFLQDDAYRSQSF